MSPLCVPRESSIGEASATSHVTSEIPGPSVRTTSCPWISGVGNCPPQSHIMHHHSDKCWLHAYRALLETEVPTGPEHVILHTFLWGMKLPSPSSATSHQDLLPVTDCHLKDRAKFGPSGVSHPQEKVASSILNPLSVDKVLEEFSPLRPLATWGALWDQMTEELLESTFYEQHQKYPQWRLVEGSCFHFFIQTFFVKNGIKGSQN